MIEQFELTSGYRTECDCCLTKITEGLDFDCLKCGKVNLCLKCAKLIGVKAQEVNKAESRELPTVHTMKLGPTVKGRSYLKEEIPDDSNHY